MLPAIWCCCAVRGGCRVEVVFPIHLTSLLSSDRSPPALFQGRTRAPRLVFLQRRGHHDQWRIARNTVDCALDLNSLWSVNLFK